MRRRSRRVFTAAERAELWYRYKTGESIKGIGRALGRDNASILSVLKPMGGLGRITCFALVTNSENQYDILPLLIAVERRIATLARGDQEFPQSLLTRSADKRMSLKNLDSATLALSVASPGCREHEQPCNDAHRPSRSLRRLRAPRNALLPHRRQTRAAVRPVGSDAQSPPA
jgi:hypothetical protein